MFQVTEWLLQCVAPVLAFSLIASHDCSVALGESPSQKFQGMDN